jgi:hypothetical protein
MVKGELLITLQCAKQQTDQPTAEQLDLYYNDVAIYTGTHTFKDGAHQ